MASKWLNFELTASSTAKEEIQEGEFLAIPNALNPAFAESVYRVLDRETAWTERSSTQENQRFRHRNLRLDRSRVPELALISSVFNQPDILRYFGNLLGERLVESRIGASWYAKGDFAAPHVDTVTGGRLSFIWFLTKDWQKGYGGEFRFEMDSESRVIEPQFNKLVLFRIGPSHSVSPVTSSCRTKRLAVVGRCLGEDNHSTVN